MTEEAERTLGVAEVLQEQDVFKLAIRGHAAIEERINATICDAFGGEMPGELKRLPFRTRLALFGALTQMPQKYATGLAALAKLRHEFAHGRLDELNPDRARVLSDAFRPMLPEKSAATLERALDPSKPRLVLVSSLHLADAAVEVMAEYLQVRREQERNGLKALALQQGLARALAEQKTE